MRQLLLLLVGLCCCHQQAEAVTVLQNVYGRQTTSLNGRWQTIVDIYDAGFYDYRMNPMKDGYFMNEKPRSKGDHKEYDFSDKETLRVPGDWNTQRRELLFYEGSMWYKKDFKYSLKKDRVLYVYFGASNYQTEVWLNGQWVGQHVGGFTPFAFDVTSHLRKGENTLVVRVNNQRRPDGVPTVNSDWWNYGGLTRDVMLVETPMAHVDDYEIRLVKHTYDEVLVKARLNVAMADVKVDVRIPELGLMAQLRTNAQGVAEARLAAKPELWSPDNPKLYDVVVRCNGEEMKDQIGFRHIETDGRKVLLNGKQVFLRGVSVHEEAPFRTGRCNTEQDDSTLISWAKFMGCNMLRLAHYPHNEQMVRMAEREGIMVWSEVPVYWTIDWSNQDTYNNAARQLRDNIMRDHNRCAIIIWSVANETPKSEPRNHFLRGLAKVVRDNDDERLLSMAMETETHDDITTVEDPLSELVDILSFNCYLGWYGGKPADCDKRRWFFAQEKPFFVSEFGAGAVAGRFGSKDEKWTEEYQAEVYRKTLAMYEKVPGFSGCSPWILMDFRSPRRQNHETQQYFNRKGLVSDRGQTKQAFYVMQDFYKKKGAFKKKK